LRVAACRFAAPGFPGHRTAPDEEESTMTANAIAASQANRWDGIKRD